MNELTKESLYNKYNIENKGCEQIAKEVNSTRWIIGKLLRKFGIKTRNTKLVTKYDISTNFLYNEFINKNKSCREISREINIPQATICYWIKRRKIGGKTLREIKEEMPIQIPITKDFLEEEYVKNKKSVKQISKELNISHNLIKKWILFYEIPYRDYYTFNKFITKEILYHEYIVEQKSALKIAREFNTNGSNIRKYLLKFNIPLRKKKTKYGEIAGNHFATIRSQAESRGLSFEITIKFIWELFLKQNRCCAISGVLLTFNDNKLHSRRTASLDRIDSERGYTEDNVQWIHKTINKLKWDYSEKEFFDWIKKIYEFKKLNSI